ncbi:MAG: HD domain-containing protein [Acidobacteriota bacterium]
MTVDTAEAALTQLAALGAPGHLEQHAVLVLEAAEEILHGLSNIGVDWIDSELVRIGAVLHDAGKIRHPAEMAGPGSDHEAAGRELLLEAGISERVARVCLSHARWSDMAVSTEELLIALADKLWKGKRHEELESRVVEAISNHGYPNKWELLVSLDGVFESVATQGDERLSRSRGGV